MPPKEEGCSFCENEEASLKLALAPADVGPVRREGYVTFNGAGMYARLDGYVLTLAPGPFTAIKAVIDLRRASALKAYDPSRPVGTSDLHAPLAITVAGKKQPFVLGMKRAVAEDERDGWLSHLACAVGCVAACHIPTPQREKYRTLPMLSQFVIAHSAQPSAHGLTPAKWEKVSKAAKAANATQKARTSIDGQAFKGVAEKAAGAKSPATAPPLQLPAAPAAAPAKPPAAAPLAKPPRVGALGLFKNSFRRKRPSMEVVVEETSSDKMAASEKLPESQRTTDSGPIG